MLERLVLIPAGPASTSRAQRPTPDAFDRERVEISPRVAACWSWRLDADNREESMNIRHILRSASVVAATTVVTAQCSAGLANSEPGNCGAHSAIQCADGGATPTTAEYAFENRLRGNVPGSNTQLLKVVRGTCFLVRQGEVTTTGMVATSPSTSGCPAPQGRY